MAVKEGPNSIEKNLAENPAETPAKNPVKNPAKKPAKNLADSTKKEGPFQYCLSYPDSLDQKGLWQLERTHLLSTVPRIFGRIFGRTFRRIFFSFELGPRQPR